MTLAIAGLILYVLLVAALTKAARKVNQLGDAVDALPSSNMDKR